MRLIIAGGRDFKDCDLMDQKLNNLLANQDRKDLTIVSGTARGADSLGATWAQAQGIPVHEFPAQWEKYGKSAGYKRNAQMAEYATHLIAFWDGKSKGTKHMIDIMERLKKPFRVIKY